MRFPGQTLAGARRQLPARDRQPLHPAAGRERHGQLREGGAARAGENRLRFAAAGRNDFGGRHVGRADGDGPLIEHERGKSHHEHG